MVRIGGEILIDCAQGRFKKKLIFAKTTTPATPRQLSTRIVMLHFKFLSNFPPINAYYFIDLIDSKLIFTHDCNY